MPSPEVEKITDLLTTPDVDSILQGVELAVSLGEPAIIEELLTGVRGGDRRTGGHVFYGIGCSDWFEARGGVERAWRYFAALRLLAESSYERRSSVEVIGIGLQPQFTSDGALPERMPLEWISKFPNVEWVKVGVYEGLELDLSPLQKLPKLTRLDVGENFSNRHTTKRVVVPSLAGVEAIYAGETAISLAGSYPKLQVLTGELDGEMIKRSNVQKLDTITLWGDATLSSFDSVGAISLRSGHVKLPGCRRIERLELGNESLDAPDLREIGLLTGGCPGLQPEALTSVDVVDLKERTRLPNLRFPESTRLGNSEAVFLGPSLTKLDNERLLEQLQWVTIEQIHRDESLEGLRKAKNLRVLDLHLSLGTWDLAPLIGLKELRAVRVHDLSKLDVPRELWHIVTMGSMEELRELSEQPVSSTDSVPCAPHLWREIQLDISNPSLAKALGGVDKAREAGGHVIDALLAGIEIRNGRPVFPAKTQNPKDSTIGPVLLRLLECAEDSSAEAERFRALEVLRLQAASEDLDDIVLDLQPHFRNLRTLTVGKVKGIVRFASLPETLEAMAVDSRREVEFRKGVDLGRLKSVSLHSGAAKGLAQFGGSGVEHLQLSGRAEIDQEQLLLMPQLKSLLLTKGVPAQNLHVVSQLKIEHIAVNPSFDLEHLVGHPTVSKIELIGEWTGIAIPPGLPVEPERAKARPLIPFN